MKVVPKFQNSGKTPTRQQIEQNKKKQEFLNQNGVKVKIDGSWGPWQQKQYERLTTKDKYYNTTPLGFLSYVYDKTLGDGTTYQEDPAFVKGYSGEIRQDDRSTVRRYLDQQMHDNRTPLGYVTQTVLPSAAIAGTLVYGTPAIIQGIRTAVADPSTILPALKVATKEGAKGAIGATAVNATSKVTTGKTWGEQVAQSTGVSSDFGEFTNPGFVLSPLAYNASAKYLQNVGRRVTETAMRTTPYANPIPEISNNFHIMLHGNNGGKGRLLHIGNYILTGKRVGPKGYYNSFAPFTQLNDIIVTKPSLRSRMKAFTQPEGTSFAFSGYVDRLGQVPPYTGGNDIIDAFLYQKTIDPKYGVRRINSDYGIHTDYVNKWYPNKKVQVYEVQNSSGIPEVEVTDKSSWLPSTEFSKDFGTNYDNVLNAAGHLKQTGIYNNARVIRRQDIWKFNPTEYKQKWFENKRLYTDEPLWKKKLLDMGLRYVDRIGTPIITRTKWIYE